MTELVVPKSRVILLHSFDDRHESPICPDKEGPALSLIVRLASWEMVAVERRKAKM